MSEKHLRPYGVALLVVTAVTLLVLLVESAFSFPPFLMFAAAVGICFIALGVRPGFLALVLSALVSDFFFIEPVGKFTRYSVVMGVYYLVAAVTLLIFNRYRLKNRTIR